MTKNLQTEVLIVNCRTKLFVPSDAAKSGKDNSLNCTIFGAILNTNRTKQANTYSQYRSD